MLIVGEIGHPLPRPGEDVWFSKTRFGVGNSLFDAQITYVEEITAEHRAKYIRQGTRHKAGRTTVHMARDKTRQNTKIMQAKAQPTQPPTW